jgi:4-diphosphocytidyl-2-C-methyl-D-erythritol kinase
MSRYATAACGGNEILGSEAMTCVSECAAAKVNLTLRVLGRRPDGYHEIESLVAFAGLGDRITLEATGGRFVQVTGPFATAIAAENIVARAVAHLTTVEPRLAVGRITLEKNLPVAAGLGGGSADAAAVLRVVRRANPPFAATLDWGAIAARLGADVPVCLLSRPSFMWGIGEKVRPLESCPQLPAVLVNPGQSLLTVAAFEALRAGPASMRLGAPPIPGPFTNAEDLIAYLSRQGNDLERPAMQLLPAIAEIKRTLSARPRCLLVRLSGSGPTCYGIFETGEAAGDAAAAIAAQHPNWWVQATQLGGAPNRVDRFTGRG